METYNLKLVPEAIWAIAVAIVVTLGMVMSGLSIDQVLADPQAVTAIGTAAIARAALAALWNGIAKLTGKAE